MPITWECKPCRMTIDLPRTVYRIAPGGDEAARKKTHGPLCGFCGKPYTLPRPDAPGGLWSFPARDKPVLDFFTLYFPCRIRGYDEPETSTHLQYAAGLLGFPRFRNLYGVEDAAGLASLFDRDIEGLRIQREVALARNVDILHFYNFAYDTRSYLHFPSNGDWSIGLTAYWLRHKYRLESDLDVEDVFPREIFTNHELSTPTAAPVVLSKRHGVLRRQFAAGTLQERVETGGMSLIAKSALDYVVGGSQAPLANPVTIDHTMDRARLEALARELSHPPPLPMEMPADLASLSWGSARFEALVRKTRGPGPQKYLVSVQCERGGKFVIALDLDDAEFFDPAIGVLTSRNRDPEILLRFLFMDYLRIFYADLGRVRRMALYKATPAE